MPVGRIRCDLHLNGGSRKLILAAGPNETAEHLALKLSAYFLFWDFEPIVGASARHPALLNQEFLPDLLALNDAGEASLWVECGHVTMHKLMKLTRRFPNARLVVVQSGPREAERTRRDLQDQVDRHAKIEILAWPHGQFASWMDILAEKTEAYGESGGLSINAVVNEHPLAVDLLRY